MRRTWIDGACGVAALLLALAGCGVPTAHEVRYTGALPGCGLAASTLTRQGDRFSFAPGDGVLTILGQVAPDGGFAGSLNTQPPTKPPFELSVHGMVGEESAAIDYTTPHCHARGTFSHVHPPPF